MSSAHDALRFALVASLQAALVAAVVAAAWYALERRAPLLRYALLGVLALKLVVPAGWNASTSVWSAPDPARTEPLTLPEPRALSMESADPPSAALPARAPAEAAAPTDRAASDLAPSLAALALMVWALGAAVRLAALAREARTLSRLRREARPIDVGAPRSVLTATSAAQSLPIAFGVLRPTVLLPPSLTSDDATRRAVVAHELAHLRHRDPLVALVAAVIGAAWWFHPAAWWLRRAVRRTQEDLVDDAVVRGRSDRPSIDPGAYCAALLDAARRSAGERAPSLTCGSGAERSLARRFRRILDPKAPERRTTTMLTLLLPLTLTLAVVPQSEGQSGVSDGWSDARSRSTSSASPASQPVGQESLEKALAWLAARQSADGSFAAQGAAPNAAGDALAVLAFLGAGNTARLGPHAETVARGVANLSTRVAAGETARAGLTRADPLAVLVLSEASVLDRAKVRGLEAGVEALVRALQSPERLDPEIAVWSSLALASARDAGVEPPASILDATVSRVPWFAAKDGGAWTDAHHAAAATLLHALSGGDPKDGRVTAATRRILAALDRGPVDEQLLHLGSYALFQVGGEPWKTWRARTNDALLAGQRDDGSWAPVDGGDAISTTALRALSLEAAWRYARITGGR
ncbi:MAG: M56 family metallopeptidase [Planctomycetota bacterium]